MTSSGLCMIRSDKTGGNFWETYTSIWCYNTHSYGISILLIPHGNEEEEKQMLQSVSMASMAGMAVSLFIAVGLPIGACVIWRKRTGAKWTSMFIGAATFFLFALILEQIFHVVVLGATGNLLMGNIWARAVYGGLCAAVFEETGRFLAMKYCMKKNLNKENSIMYGIGHGGIEAILIVGMSMVSNLVTSVMINSGQFEAVLNAQDETTRATTLSQVSALWTTAPHLFFMGGIERISAFFLHVALSFMVYKAVKNQKQAYFFLAMFLHFLVDAGTVLLASVLAIPVLEAVLLVSVALIWGFLRKDYIKEA